MHTKQLDACKLVLDKIRRDVAVGTTTPTRSVSGGWVLSQRTLPGADELLQVPTPV